MPIVNASPIPPDTAIDDIAEDVLERVDFADQNLDVRGAIAAALSESLAARELHLMRLTDERAPIRHAVTTRTPAGPVSLAGADHNGLGIKLIAETCLTGHVTALMLKYPEAGELGAWLVARAVKATSALRAKRAPLAARWKGPAVDAMPPV